MYLPPLGESDHVCLRFNVLKSQNIDDVPNSYNIFKTDYKAVIKDLQKYDWQDILISTFHEDYDKFFDILHTSLKKHSPKKKKPKEKKNIYMTNAAIRLKNAKKRHWKRYVSTQTEYDKRNYVKCKNNLRKLTRQLRKNYEENLAKNSKRNPKMFWKYANSRLKSRARIPSLIQSNGSRATTSKEKADALNNFFASTFTVENLEEIPETPTHPVDQLLSTVNITPEIVKSKLESLNSSKSPGPDKWHSHFLKELANIICIPLSILFNKSLIEGAHNSWLQANITPIFKKGKRSSPTNYRPVSLTSTVSKIMESIVRDKILAHMIKNGMIDDNQHGFVPGRDCITQLLLCMEEWTSILERNQAFDLIYTDFSKAFDSVPHKRLLQKLKSIGIDGDLFNWVKSFLSGRIQRVNVDGVLSDWISVISGVPQGSVLGPLLFVIYINDLSHEVKMNFCKLFADDCKIYGNVGRNIDNSLHQDLKNLEIWSQKWQLLFNTTKCKVLHFGYSNQNESYNIYGSILEAKNEEKDLGIIIDNKLKFHVNTSAVTKKANQVLGVLKKAYTSRDPLTITTLYKAFVRPHLEYGNVIWGPFYEGDKHMIERVQRRVSKLVPELKDLPYEERLKRLRLPSLEYRRKRGDMIWMYKIMNELVRIDSTKLFTPYKISKTRGHERKVVRKHAVKLVRINSFAQRTVNNWNSLPEYVVEAKSLNTFKNRLDEHWRDQCYNSKY